MPRSVSLVNTQSIRNNPNTGISRSAMANLPAILSQVPDLLTPQAIEAFVNDFLTQIDDVTGLDLVDFAKTLESWFSGSDNLLTALVDWLFGINNSSTSALQGVSWLNNLWNDVVALFTGSGSATALLSLIAAPAVANVTQNLQQLWDFPTAVSVSGSGQWSWSGGIDHTGTAGSGSAQCVCNGVLQGLRGTVGAVQPDQTVTLQAFVTWSGVSAASGTHPFQLQVIPYSGLGSSLTAGTPTTPSGCEITSAGASSTTYSGEVAGWVELTGSYTVPSSGVTALQLRLLVTADATAGTVNWDDCTALVSGGYLATLENDITTLQDDAAASTAAFATFLQAVLADIEGYTSWSPFIAAVESAWDTYTTTESGLISAEIFTIQQFLNTLLGINTSTGQMAATNVSQSLGGSSLGADVQAILDYIANALGHTGTGHTLANIETYLGLIPPTNVTNVLGGSSLGADVQAILDYIANALGHTGTGHTLTQIETYLGLIPPANVTSVLGGANLGDDVSTQNTWFGRLMTDVSIYLDLFHVTYPVGSPSDGPTTTISGVRTWYSAIADILALFGIVHSTSAPSTPVSDVGTTASVAAAAATTAGTNASIAIASASAANTLAQGTIDGLNTAWSAGGTGNPVTTIPTIASAIPTSAIVGGTGAAVAFGAVGAGNAAAFFGATTASISWSHTIATGDLGVLVFIGYSLEVGAPTATSAVTYGGTAMTMLQRETSSLSSGFTYAILEAWWLKSPPSGAKTVAVSLSGNNFSGLVGDSASYSASKIGTVGPNTGGGSTSLSMSAASTTGPMVAGAFSSVISSDTPALSAYNQTSRYNNNATLIAFVMGDAAGASSVAFTATSSVPGSHTASEVQWSGITVELTN